MLVTFEPLLRFYFYKMLDRSELYFLLIDHLSTCLPVTTRRREPHGDFAKNGLCWKPVNAHINSCGIRPSARGQNFGISGQAFMEGLGWSHNIIF